MRIAGHLRKCQACNWIDVDAKESSAAARLGSSAALIVIGLPSLAFGLAAVLWGPRQSEWLDEVSIRWLAFAGYGCLGLTAITVLGWVVVRFVTRKSIR